MTLSFAVVWECRVFTAVFNANVKVSKKPSGTAVFGILSEAKIYCCCGVARRASVE